MTGALAPSPYDSDAIVKADEGLRMEKSVWGEPHKSHYLQVKHFHGRHRADSE